MRELTSDDCQNIRRRFDAAIERRQQLYGVDCQNCDDESYCQKCDDKILKIEVRFWDRLKNLFGVTW